MPRAKTGTVRRRRHAKVLKRAKGYWGLRSKSVRVATQTLLNAADYAYRDRRDKKAEFRRLWIARINAAARHQLLLLRRRAAQGRRDPGPQGPRRPRRARAGGLQGPRREGQVRRLAGAYR